MRAQPRLKIYHRFSASQSRMEQSSSAQQEALLVTRQSAQHVGGRIHEVESSLSLTKSPPHSCFFPAPLFLRMYRLMAPA